MKNRLQSELKKFKIVLFLFRRDLRIEDNTGLMFALKHAEIVVPAFILTPEQIEHNPFRSDHCLKFMIESLQDLDMQLEEKGAFLHLFRGKPEEIVNQCIGRLKLEAVVVNRDYTPYSQQRDLKIETVCKNKKIPFYAFDDALLHSPEETLKNNGDPYKIFTPYYRYVTKLEVAKPQHNPKNNYFRKSIPGSEAWSILSHIVPKRIKNSLVGGRSEAVKILKKIGDLNEGSHLSPYLKFTVCSPREVYAALVKANPSHPLIRALHWRDFFTKIAFFFPYVFTGAFHSKYNSLKWSCNQEAFQRWCMGTTGFPIVDAAMREMNATGFMSNRMRMVTASFLIKDLYVDWRWGEKYFAQTLVDYDPAVNNGNWQWVAGTGCDAQPYFRIFNPWSQQKKFDPDCHYIKTWLPELKNLDARSIHKWHTNKDNSKCSYYPAPMVDHEEAAKKNRAFYQLAKIEL
jgi:deoxyribodipyrimidine photo-lyase